MQNRTEELRRLFGLPITEASQPAAVAAAAVHGAATERPKPALGLTGGGLAVALRPEHLPFGRGLSPALCMPPPVVPALLPRLQSLIDDFSCALKKRMLLQGRMYVFQEHACFHCNLFGYQKIKASSGCTAAPALRMQRMRCRVHWRADDSATRNAAGIRPGCITGVGHGNLREWNSRAALLTALLTAPRCLCRRR